ncbi:MAG: 4-hydroxy-tetrahydrodipicolinate reductase, partial [bacterium]
MTKSVPRKSPVSKRMRKPAPILKLAVAGAMGRMGHSILSSASQDRSWNVVAGWERRGHADLGKDLGLAAGLAALGLPLSQGPDVERADVVVDFSAPAATMDTLAAVLRSRRHPSLVIGTTGLDTAQVARIKAASRRLRIVLASNYSVGMNLLWKALEFVACTTGEAYDVEVIETHHHDKRDSPSGTAMTTAEVLARALGRELPVWARFGRPKGNIGPRDPREIGLH